MNKRATITVRGIVRGNGFKGTVEKIAYDLDLKGTAKNLPDGNRVEIIVEGPESAIRKFIRKIRIHESGPFPILVTNIQTSWSKSTGQYEFFDILTTEEDRAVWKAIFG